MKITITLCSLLLSSVAWAGSPALEGIVKDASGHPLKGADVTIEARTGHFSKKIKTDANGHYISDGLAAGTLYKVTLTVNGSVKASILNANVHEGKPNELNFDLRTTKRPVKTHMVYVAQELGTHIGGGRWIEVDENGNPVNASDNANIQNVGSGRNMQTFSPGASRTSGSH